MNHIRLRSPRMPIHSNARRHLLATLIMAGVASAAAGVVALPTADDAQPPRGRQTGLAEDRAVWQSLLRDHTQIRRTLIHRADGVESLTESDDPDVAARIIAHAKSMQERMRDGARVRAWDPVFVDLFAQHEGVSLEVTPTARGVRIVEKGASPEVIALIRSHAMGVSDFVRLGPAVAQRETRRFEVGAPLPLPEVVIGGVRHRLLLAQPDEAAIARMRDEGVDTIVSFRRPIEQPDFDERAVVESLGMHFVNLPFANASELTDALIDDARETLRQSSASNETTALHCRTGNRAGVAWAAFRALDQGIPVTRAIAEAHALQLVDPLSEAHLRGYLRDRLGADGAWRALSRDAMDATQSAMAVRATEARDALFSRLFAALGEVLAKPEPEGGPVAAIAVCKSVAPKLAREIARDRALLIGRTSAKLRNSGNAAPAWAVALLGDHASSASDAAPTGPASPREFPAPRFAIHTDGSFGALLPIRTLSACTMCHGPADSIAPAIRDAVAREYPDDSATGFREGDLRGWFWIELPGS